MTAYTPNLPALITALPGDHTRAPQTEFTRARQVLFLQNLSVTGSVRSAACAVGTSHQTAYRARRATAAFRAAWDAALVVARANAESVLACRAIDGIEEKVFYHGEEVATRTRYSDRLLLAHLARLDRHAADARINAIAEDFDAALARFEAGEEVLVAGVGDPSAEAPASAGTQHPSPAEAGVSGGCAPGGNFSPGPCNTRSMSYSSASAGGEGAAAAEDAEEELDPDELPIGYDDDEDWPPDPADYADLFAGESKRASKLPFFDRIYAAMDRLRPADAPGLQGKGHWSEHDLLDEQAAAFMERVDRWWLVVPPRPGDPGDEWRFHEPDA
jgi:hypothetical protein